MEAARAVQGEAAGPVGRGGLFGLFREKTEEFQFFFAGRVVYSLMSG
jgi:hypothetical protein